MGTLWSELGPLADAATARPRVYADANVPAGIVALHARHARVGRAVRDRAPRPAARPRHRALPPGTAAAAHAGHARSRLPGRPRFPPPAERRRAGDRRRPTSRAWQRCWRASTARLFRAASRAPLPLEGRKLHAHTRLVTMTLGLDVPTDGPRRHRTPTRRRPGSRRAAGAAAPRSVAARPRAAARSRDAAAVTRPRWRCHIRATSMAAALAAVLRELLPDVSGARRRQRGAASAVAEQSVRRGARASTRRRLSIGEHVTGGVILDGKPWTGAHGLAGSVGVARAQSGRARRLPAPRRARSRGRVRRHRATVRLAHQVRRRIGGR